MKKRKEYDDIHIPFILKELIIVFVIVTFHWVFISFSASDVHLDHRSRPLSKTLSQEESSGPSSNLTASKISLVDLDVPGTPTLLASPKGSAEIIDGAEKSDKDPKKHSGHSRRSVNFLTTSTPSPDRPGGLRKPSSTDTGGSSTEVPVTDAVRRALFLQPSNEGAGSTVDSGIYEIPDQREASVKTHKRPLVLSGDGGGYRALFAASYLAGFPEKSRKIRAQLYPELEEHEATDLRARANILAGTSAGGVNALSYMMMAEDGSYVYSLEQVKQAYPVEAKKIFDVSWRDRLNFTRGILRGTFYKKENLYEVLQSKFLNLRTNKQTKFSELGRSDQSLLILATTTGRRPMPRIFRSWDARKRTSENFEAWQVAAATTAAPVYFGRAVLTHEGENFYLDDGGLSANNPIFFAYKEAEMVRRSLKVDMKDFIFLSIGTGVSGEFVNPRRTQNNSVMQTGFSAIVNAQMSAADATAEDLMKQAFLQDQFKYHRIQPPLPGPRKKLDRHGEGQTLFFHGLAEDYLDDIQTINLVKDLDEQIPDLPDKSVLDTSDVSET